MILGPFYQNKLLFGYRVTRFGYFLLPKTHHISKFEYFMSESLYCQANFGILQSRLWKDHLKNDLRSDQDQRQKIDLRSRSRF
jgi:hypothetical protein